MTAGARRVALYWLLLLVPTLAAGGGAVWLLAREQARLDAQAALAGEGRRAALEARARLVAENVELLLGDVRNGLMTTLRDAPAAGTESFLDAWERSTPFIRQTFLVSGEGRLVRPAPRTGDREAWLRRWLASGAPWSVAPKAEVVLSDAQPAEASESLRARRDISQNVSKVQSARIAVQDAVAFSAERQEPVLAGAAAPTATGATDAAAPRAPARELAKVSAPGSAGAPLALGAASPPATPERSGWAAFRDGTELHLAGWRLVPTGGVVGVEIELEEIVRRLADLLPGDGEFADAIAFRDGLGEIRQEKSYGLISRSRVPDPGRARVTVPISEALLPGWQVVGFLPGDVADSVPRAGFLLVGGLLVACFVAAILSGGALLLQQARASEAEAARRTTFVANVSHEFKTPLTTIRLYAELLEQGRVASASQQISYLRTIGEETQRLARLVNNALDFSRLEQGRRTYSRTPLDLRNELGRLLDTLGPRFAEADMKEERDFPADPVVVTADRDAFEQIVLNLVDNACKYASEGRALTVALRPLPAGAEIRVSDRGPGVPADHRERIFEKFHRVDSTLTSPHRGTGLGLSIARQLARGLGGDLRFEPRPGGGASFILTLP
jgi:two-component system, OmpR family, phosphate regulon sensor histidine kinase PhoR